jgi:hypothetical protein
VEKQMREGLMTAVRRTPLYRPLRAFLGRRDVARWEAQGRPVPPPHEIKERTLKAYAARYRLAVLVETGTFSGTMVEALRGGFERVYSIELGDDLYDKAVRRFAGKDDVELIHGDSATELRRLVPRLDRPALFWLDAHYSGGVTARGSQDTPVCAEIEAVLASHVRRNVILIDDARCFGTDPAYPTLDEVRSIIGSRDPAAGFDVADDIIRITPPTLVE